MPRTLRCYILNLTSNLRFIALVIKMFRPILSRFPGLFYSFLISFVFFFFILIHPERVHVGNNLKRTPITDSLICEYETKKPYDGTVYLLKILFFFSSIGMSKSSIFEYIGSTLNTKIMTTNTPSTLTAE